MEDGHKTKRLSLNGQHKGLCQCGFATPTLATKIAVNSALVKHLQDVGAVSK